MVMFSGLFRHVSPLKLLGWLKGANVFKSIGWWRLALRVLPFLGKVLATFLPLVKRLFGSWRLLASPRRL